MGKIQAAVGENLFRIGDSGPVVQAIQLGLRDAGYALKGTAYFGPATDTAVSTFQKRAGLKADGVFGPASALALDALLEGLALGAKPNTPPAEIGRPLWLEAGIKLIGTKEAQGGGDSKTIIDWAKEEGGAIARDYTHDEIPWCALFANHILTHVGLKGTETLWALDFAGKWPSVLIKQPCVGAFAPMLRNGGGHIICIAGKDQHGNIMGLGGNQRDEVSIVPFPMSRLNKGFWWPDSVPVPALIGMEYLPIVRSDGRVSSKES
jgi:uncharacterized protein (TIGR02594 family)